MSIELIGDGEGALARLGVVAKLHASLIAVMSPALKIKASK